ncbi:MAG: hypothetical protein DWI57_09290 [Chloroflexi bacterium]|nr:MAG: hypothetical protein DWI57_09290 [Chloroflexota bacterium]
MSLSATNRPVSFTTIPHRWRWPTRVAWLLIAATSLTIFILSNRILLTTPPPSCIAAEIACGPGTISLEDAQILMQLGLPDAHFWLTLLSVLARSTLAVTGAVIFWRKSDDWVAVIISAGLLTVLIEGSPAGLVGWEFLISLLYGIGTVLFYPIPFVFPNGHCEPPGLKLTVWGLAIAGGVAFSLSYVFPVWFAIGGLVNGVWTLLAIYAMVYRYNRVSTGVERQQIKWVLAALTAVLIQGSIWFSISLLFPVALPSSARSVAVLIGLLSYMLGYSFFSYSFLVAMLRYRLWDIDILIRRTLQYTLLTGLLALVYFGTIVLLQTLFGSFSGEQSPAVIVLSTLLIAALFTPLRRRVQDVIDRRFFRKKYDAQQVLAKFALTARDETDLDALTGELQRVVQETLQPEGVSIWLKR